MGVRFLQEQINGVTGHLAVGARDQDVAISAPDHLLQVLGVARAVDLDL